MTIQNWFSLLGGIGLFLYGMKLLGVSLERLAGAGLEKTLEKLTNSKWKGLALGTIVTGVIQSSAATTVMLVGFVNAGIMKLAQAVPVIMGANIGTTVTGQILRLGDIGGQAGTLISFLKPSSFAPLLIGIGAFILLISKNKKIQNVASLFLGLGILFFGMTTMENALTPLRESETFQELFFIFKNPLLGVLLGAVVTAILQSSSASVGILQAIAASTGTVTFSMTAPIVMGQNIGKCITVLLASFGTNKKAKRVVVCHLAINIIGVIIFLIAIYGFQSLIGFSFWDTVMTRGNIADFHTLFNVVTSIILIPFCSQLVKLSGRILKDDGQSKIDWELAMLEDIFLDTPAIALEQCKKVMNMMAETVKENLMLSHELLYKPDVSKAALLAENEDFLDKSETRLSEYLVKITANELQAGDLLVSKEIMYCISDFERIGDHCINIYEAGQYMHSENIRFTTTGNSEIEALFSAVIESVDLTVAAFLNDDLASANRIEPLEQLVDEMKETFRSNHVDRLQGGRCNVQNGMSFLELLTNLERISDHCSNIGLHVIDKLNTNENFDFHEAAHNKHRSEEPEYMAMYQHYRNQYLLPVMNNS